MAIETRSRSKARKNAEQEPPVDVKRSRKNTIPVLQKADADDVALGAVCVSRDVGSSKVPVKKSKQSKPQMTKETRDRSKVRKNVETQLPVDSNRSRKDTIPVLEKVVAGDALDAGCASRDVGSCKVLAKTHIPPVKGIKNRQFSGTTTELNTTIRQILLPRYRTTSSGTDAEKLIGMVSYAIVRDYQLKESLKSYRMPLELIAAAFNSCNKFMDLVNVTLRKPEENAKQYSICDGQEQESSETVNRRATKRKEEGVRKPGESVKQCSISDGQEQESSETVNRRAAKRKGEESEMEQPSKKIKRSTASRNCNLDLPFYELRPRKTVRYF